MATSQDSPGKKPATKTTTTLTVKKATLKKETGKKVATAVATKKPKAAVAQAQIQAQIAAKTPASKPVATKISTSKQGVAAPVAKASVTPEERYKMIAAAAYSKAEQRGFASGYALNDWIAAEKEIDAMPRV